MPERRQAKLIAQCVVASDGVADALEKFAIKSPVEFSFAGEPATDVRKFQAAPSLTGAPPRGEDPLVTGIQATLYERCYAQRSGAGTGTSSHVDPAFAQRLAVANTGRERWDLGWTIRQFGPNGQAFVSKGDRERVAMPGTFVFDGVPGMAPQIGANVSLRVARDTFDAQPGYYFAFGDTLDELADQLSLVRFYFHCGAENAAKLLGALTAALNRFHTPFQFKTPAAPALYGRTDAAVLYIGQRYFPIVSRLVAPLRDTIPLEAATPLFTKALWPGIGVAVEPGSGESFGSHRCRLVAEGIVDAWRGGEEGLKARLTAVAARFAAAGLDLARPWIGPTGVDPFQLPQAARLP